MIKHRIIGFALCAAAVIALCAGAAINLTRTWALERTAMQNGMNWAHYLDQHLSYDSSNSAHTTSTDIGILAQGTALEEIATDVFSVGSIYQIDFVNNAGDIVKTYVAQTMAHDEEEHGHGHAHTHVEPTRRVAPEPFALDTEVMRAVIENFGSMIVVHPTSEEGQTGAFSEVFHVVEEQGQVHYAIRILVDLRSEYRLYSQMLYWSVALILTLLVVAFGLPARKHLRALRLQDDALSQAQYLAEHDVLTGIDNRRSFYVKVDALLKENAKAHKSVCIYVFDLDCFKEVNDLHGHHAGDATLVEFARLLESHAPQEAVVARLAGDEFVVAIGGLDSDGLRPKDLLGCPHKFKVRFSEQTTVLTVSLTGGATVFPKDGVDITTLLRNADLALYDAKNNNPGTLVEFTEHHYFEFKERIQLKDEFQACLENSEIEPYYQPLVDMNNGRVVGFEALARWNHPVRGVLTASAFSELLDDDDISAALGQEMLKKVVADMKVWHAANLPFQCVGINVSNGDLNAPDFATGVIEHLYKNGIPPSCLAIEVTENCVFGQNRNCAMSQLETLGEAGCDIALDDFGTGYSSITQLKDLPITAVKVDKSFVSEAETSAADQAILDALLGLGRDMDFLLVLEGVETISQKNFLNGMGFRVAQGYFYAPAVSAAELPDLLNRDFSDARLSGNVQYLKRTKSKGVHKHE